MTSAPRADDPPSVSPKSLVRADEVDEEERNLEGITEVLVSVANGRFDKRVQRTFDGGPWDVLAYMANETAAEVEQLVSELHRERQELQQAQERLHQAEKLAALGELSGGVAHELNQPLTVLQTLAELLLERPEMTIEQRRRELELIGSAAARMGRIVSAVRTFGRQAPLELGEVELAHPIREALHLLEEPLRSAEIDVELNLEESSSTILGDDEALQQVFINLLSNARDILVETRQGRQKRIVLTLQECGDKTCALVDDNGPGVPPQLVGKLFDPFFSTKSIGRGTGLGLSISHRIIAEHRGTLTYSRSPLGGARFELRFSHFGEDER